MISVIIMLCVTAYGIYYAINPKPSLRRRFGDREIPAGALRTARIFGVIIAVLGAAVSVYMIVRLMSGNG